MTIFCPEYISCLAVELAFANFGEVQRVYHGTRTFNRNLRNSKRHVRIFPTGGDPTILPRMVTFLDGISREVLYKEKIVDCYRCDTRHALSDGCPEALCNQPNVAPHEQSSSSPDHTPTPSKHAATDGASTVMFVHRKAEAESARESLSIQSGTDSKISDSGTLEERENSDDSAPTLQEKSKNSPPRNTSQQHQARYLNPFRNVPENKESHFAESVYKSKFILKRIYHKKFISTFIDGFEIPHASQCRLEYAFKSALNLAILKNITIFHKRLEMDKDMFNRQFNWEMSVEDYHAHLVNIIELSTELWNGAFESTE